MRLNPFCAWMLVWFTAAEVLSELWNVTFSCSSAAGAQKVCQLCCRSLFFLGTKTSLGHFKVKKSCKGCSGLFLTACVSDATRQAGCRKGCQLRSASDMLLCQHLFGCWRPAASARTSTHWKYPSCQYCNGNLFGVEWKRDDVTRACRRLPADSRLLWKVRFCSRLQGSRRVM